MRTSFQEYAKVPLLFDEIQIEIVSTEIPPQLLVSWLYKCLRFVLNFSISASKHRLYSKIFFPKLIQSFVKKAKNHPQFNKFYTIL